MHLLKIIGQILVAIIFLLILWLVEVKLLEYCPVETLPEIDSSILSKRFLNWGIGGIAFAFVSALIWYLISGSSKIDRTGLKSPLIGFWLLFAIIALLGAIVCAVKAAQIIQFNSWIIAVFYLFNGFFLYYFATAYFSPTIRSVVVPVARRLPGAKALRKLADKHKLLTRKNQNKNQG